MNFIFEYIIFLFFYLQKKFVNLSIYLFIISRFFTILLIRQNKIKINLKNKIKTGFKVMLNKLC